MIKKNNDDATRRAQQIQKKQKFMKKNKYQRLNRFELLNNNTNEKNEMSIHNIEEKMSIIMSEKKRSKQNL